MKIILKLFYKATDDTSKLKCKLLALCSNMYRRWITNPNLISYVL